MDRVQGGIEGLGLSVCRRQGANRIVEVFMFEISGWYARQIFREG